MSLKDGEMQVVSLFGALVLSGALIVPVVYFTEAAEAGAPPLANREVLSATLAYKKTAVKQPQKLRDQPDVVKPQGVSHDENKKVEEKKDEKKPKDPKVDSKDPFKGLRRPDEESGAPTTNPGGDFNGSEKGFAPVSTGEPFFGRLRADMNFQFPEIAKAQSIPVGCIHLQPDGRIKAFTFDPPIGQKGDDDLQTAAEAALSELKKARNQNPEAVPTHLLEITKQWLCFKFSVSSG
jgi:hypothetical protein